jgi:ligand-binding sensor domain-containing protein
LIDPDSAGQWKLFNTTNGLPSNNISDLRLDRNGNLWLTFPGYGSARYSDGAWLYYPSTVTPILNTDVNCVTEAADGAIIFGTENGIYTLSSSNTWSYTDVDPVIPARIKTVKVAKNGAIWVGTEDQGFYVNKGSGFVKTLSPEYKTVNIIEEDALGNIWIGTENGLIKWNGISYTYLNRLNGLPGNRVSSLHKDSKKRLWIGTRGGKTATWIDSGGLHQLSLMNGKDTCIVNDIMEDRRGNVWFATTFDGIIKYDGIIPRMYNSNNTQLPEDIVKKIGQDSEGNLWFVLATQGVVRYTLPLE